MGITKDNQMNFEGQQFYIGLVYAERVPFVGREFICPAMRSNTSFNSARVGTWK